jgi:hypothetical protein
MEQFDAIAMPAVRYVLSDTCRQMHAISGTTACGSGRSKQTASDELEPLRHSNNRLAAA